jgi:hypothetical protein
MYQNWQFEVSSASVIDFSNVTQYSLFRLTSEVEAVFGVAVYVSLALKKKLQVVLTVLHFRSNRLHAGVIRGHCHIGRLIDSETEGTFSSL